MAGGAVRHHPEPLPSIVGRDHSAGRSQRPPFYGPYDAQELYRKHEQELGITMVPFKEMVYVENKAEYLAADETEPGDKVVILSGAEFRRRLREGLEIPEWFSFPKVVEELRRAHPPKHEQGSRFFTELRLQLVHRLLRADGRCRGMAPPRQLLDGASAQEPISERR
jgi:sulfate adenylyltransferase